MFWLWAVLLWLGFAALAVGCGALRVLLLEPLVGPGTAHVLGTLAVCALFLALIAWFVGRWGLHGNGRLLALGVLWMTLTIAFEFGFGHYVMGHPWERLLADYNVFAGRIWVLVLATMLLGPLGVRRVLG